MFETPSTLRTSRHEPGRHGGGDDGAARHRHHFVVRAEPEPSVLARVLELFSILSVVPEGVRSRRAGAHDRELRIDVLTAGLSRDKARHLELRIDQFPSVRSVRLEKEPAPGAELDYREAVYQMRRALRRAG